jgi:hypothetical protein
VPEEELSVIIRLKDFATKGLKKFAGAVARSASYIRNKLAAVKRAVFSLKGALLALGAVAFAKSFLDAGAQLEKFRTQLIAVMDQNKALATSTLKWVRDFAAYTPHATADVIQSFVTLQAAGVQANKQMMSTLGNVAYVFDRNIADVSLGLVSMEKEIFKRLGIQWEIVGKKAKIWSGKTVVETDKAAESMRKGILEIWAKKFPGAMKRAENDYKGLVELLKSQWWEYRADVMDAGVMDYIKSGLGAATEMMTGFGGSAEKTAEAIVSGMKTAFLAIAMVADGARVGAIALIWLGKIAKQGQKAKKAWDMRAQQQEFKTLVEGGSEALDEQRGKIDDITLMENEIEALRSKSYVDLVNQWHALIDIDATLGRIVGNSEKIKAMREGVKKSLKDVWPTTPRDLWGATGPDLKAHAEDYDYTKDPAYKEMKKNMEAIEKRAETGKKIAKDVFQLQLDEAEKRFKKIKGLVESIGGVLEDHILRAIDAAVEGTFNWQRAVQGLLQDFGRMAAQAAIQAGIKIVGTAIGGAFAGGPTPASAQGNVFQGGINIPRYQHGGIISGPQMALVGENQTRTEAVVPLQRDAEGNLGVGSAGGGTTNIYITAMDGADVMRVLTANPEAVAAGVAQARRNNPGFLGG